MAEASEQRRVFKKAALSEVVTVYLGRRDFYDHGAYVDPIDGMVAVNQAALAGRKVFARFNATFNYDMGGMDAMGVGVRKVLYSNTVQVFPPMEDAPLTRLQTKLRAKVGDSAFPFLFRLPVGVPPSVTLQSLAAAGPAAGKNRCGVDHEVLVFVAEARSAKFSKKNSVRLNVRKLSYAQRAVPVALPSGRVDKSFLLGSGQLSLSLSLDKEVYYHGEALSLLVKVDNHSSRAVKGIVIKVRQFCEFRSNSGRDAFSSKCIIAQLESSIGFPINSGTSTEHTYSLVPSRQDNLNQSHLALDGQLKDEDTSLASSTIVAGGDAEGAVGIIVSYEVKVALTVNLASDVICKLPFTLTAPKPPSEPDEPARGPGRSPNPRRADGAAKAGGMDHAPFGEDELELEFVEFVKGRAEKFFTAEEDQDGGGEDEA